mmetsp:Transcript_18701/g.31871  ORF Transcript_18701/g.31871 Transcript_18701/m.31871 type:complete len:92 (-) Transcript_18701:225-500(-)
MRPVHVVGALSCVAVALLLVSAGLVAVNSTLLILLLAASLPAVSLAVYLLTRLVHEVLTFRSCPEEAAALKQELEVAKRELAAKGFWPPPT